MGISCDIMTKQDRNFTKENAVRDQPKMRVRKGEIGSNGRCKILEMTSRAVLKCGYLFEYTVYTVSRACWPCTPPPPPIDGETIQR
jgi:hypothetical protein